MIYGVEYYIFISRGGGERCRQGEQEVQAHCRGSAEEDDQIMRKFNVQICKRKVCNMYDTIFHLFVNMF